MRSRWILPLISILFSLSAICAEKLSNEEKQLLKQEFVEGQEFYLLKPYLEGDVKGLHVYKVFSDRPAEFHQSWRDVVNPERRLLRGDKVQIESAQLRGDHLELRIKTIERKETYLTGSQRFLSTAMWGLPGMAAGQGAHHMQPQSKLRFYGDSAEVIKTLVKDYLSQEPPKIELQPGMSVDEVKEILGEPSEVITFGDKTTFYYPRLEAVFVNDGLKDIVVKEPPQK